MPAWSLDGPELVYRSRRIRQAETMDSKAVPREQRRLALEGLERIAAWPGQRAPLLRTILGQLGLPNGRRRKLVEVGAGSGTMATWMQARLAERGHRAEVLATDRVAVPGVRRLDALKGPLPEADLYFSNLFLHHLPDAQLSLMLERQAAASRVGLAHFDLHRHALHYYGALALMAATRLPRINLVDGLRSIQQGYTRAELQALAAGLPGARVAWSFPFRWMLAWRRS